MSSLQRMSSRSCSYLVFQPVVITSVNRRQQRGPGSDHQVHLKTARDLFVIVRDPLQEPSRSAALLGPAGEGPAHEDYRQAGQDRRRGEEALGVVVHMVSAAGQEMVSPLTV